MELSTCLCSMQSCWRAHMQLVRCVSESTDDLGVSRTVVVNLFFIVYVFSEVTVAKAAVWKGTKCGCFCLGLAPFSCCFVSLAAKRKSGWRICGSLICGVVLFGCDLICLCFGAGQLCYVPPFFHRLCIRTVPQSIYGQTRGKKKVLACLAPMHIDHINLPGE